MLDISFLSIQSLHNDLIINSELKAKRKKSREEVSKPAPPKSCRLNSTSVPPSSFVTKTTPLYENGRLIGEKVMSLKRSISEPNHYAPIKADCVKTELVEEDHICRELLPNVHVKSEPLNWKNTYIPILRAAGLISALNQKRPTTTIILCFCQFKQIHLDLSLTDVYSSQTTLCFFVLYE